MVISKHGTVLVGHKGQIKKEDSAFLWCTMSNWTPERDRWRPRWNKAGAKNRSECHDAGVVYSINVTQCASRRKPGGLGRCYSLVKLTLAQRERERVGVSRQTETGQSPQCQIESFHAVSAHLSGLLKDTWTPSVPRSSAL